MQTYGQDRGSAIIEFDYHDLKTGVFVPVLRLPHAAVMTGGTLVVTEASDGTTDGISVGTAGAPAANLANTSVKATGNTPFTATTLANGALLGLTRTSTGTPTKGKGFVIVDYICPGKCDYIVGDLNDAEEAIAEANLNVPR